VLTDTSAFLEPAWKMILSNKMLLPLLWEGFPSHENLLPAFDTQHADLGASYVKKPIFGAKAITSPWSVPVCSIPPAGATVRKDSSTRPTSRLPEFRGQPRGDRARG
jgi:hypothetical protein